MEFELGQNSEAHRFKENKVLKNNKVFKETQVFKEKKRFKELNIKQCRKQFIETTYRASE